MPRPRTDSGKIRVEVRERLDLDPRVFEWLVDAGRLAGFDEGPYPDAQETVKKYLTYFGLRKVHEAKQALGVL